jgi:hypothetical protein
MSMGLKKVKAFSPVSQSPALAQSVAALGQEMAEQDDLP